MHPDLPRTAWQGEELHELLPHRPPFRLIDRFQLVEPQARGVGWWTPDPNDPVFSGHFPGDPVLPGVLTLEACAQTAAALALAGAPASRGTSVFLAGIESARFRRPIRPGETLQISVSVGSIRRGIWKLDAEVHIGETRACSCTLTAALPDPQGT
jgi:3-hydroxyacyl-[acyl-carrier-protein] dehydratase